MLLGLLLRLPALILQRALERLGIRPSARLDPEPEPWDLEPEEPVATRNGPPPPTAAEALARSAARAADAPEPEPDLAPPVELRPTHVDREAVVVESSGPAEQVGATIEVDEPWEGYATMSAGAIVTRLRGADTATKAVVRLYESGHKNRATVLRATE